MPWASAISIPLVLAAMSAGAGGDPSRETFPGLKGVLGPSSRLASLGSTQLASLRSTLARVPTANELEGHESTDPMVRASQANQANQSGHASQASHASQDEGRREVRWVPLKRVGVPGIEVFEVLHSSTNEVAGLGLGLGANGANGANGASDVNGVNGSSDVPVTTEEVVAQIDLAQSTVPQVDLRLSPLGGLDVQSIAALERGGARDRAREDNAQLPLVMRAQERDDSPRWVVSDKARRAAGWTLVSGGLASGALATYFALLTSQHELDEGSRNPAMCKTPGCRLPGQPQPGTGRPDSRAVSSALGGAGVAVLATGGLFLMTTPALNLGERARLGAGVRSTNTGFLVMTGEW